MTLATKENHKHHMIRTILSLAGPTMLEQFMQTAVQYIDIAMIGALGTYATAAVGATTTIHWLVNSSIAALGIGFLSHIARACGEDAAQAAQKTRQISREDDKHPAVPAAARETGQHRKVRTAAHITNQAVLVTLAVGIFFTILTVSLSSRIPGWMQVDPSLRSLASEYFFILYLPMLPRTASLILGTVLRAAGDTKTPMRISIVMNLINVVLNFFLIFPVRSLSLRDWFAVIPGNWAMTLSGDWARVIPGDWTVTVPGAGLGVAGAAIASAIAFTWGGICITAAVFRHPLISPLGLPLRPDRRILLPCMKIALPGMLQRFGTSLGYVAFASIINSLGSVATAAHTIANTVESAFYIPGFGMQTAAATLAGNCLGAQDNRRMREFSHRMILLEVVLMVISGGLLFLFAPVMMGLFTKEEEVIRLGAIVLRMVALSEPFYGVSIVLEGMMQGVGQTMVPFRFNILGMWGIRITGTFLCVTVFHLGLTAAWACMITHNLTLFVLFLLYYRNGRWNPLNPSLPRKLGKTY